MFFFSRDSATYLSFERPKPLSQGRPTAVQISNLRREKVSYVFQDRRFKWVLRYLRGRIELSAASRRKKALNCESKASRREHRPSIGFLRIDRVLRDKGHP